MTGDGPAIEARGLVKVYGETRRLGGDRRLWSLIATAAITLVFAPLTVHLYSRQG
jgi:hypothetical protein